MIWGLCVLCLAGGLGAGHAGPVRKALRIEDTASTWEEINLLVFGVLQFRESLRYVHETIEAKLAKVRRAMRSHEATLQRLGRQTEHAAEVEKQTKELIRLLQAHMTEQHTKTTTMKDRLASMEQQEVELQTKVERLETRLKKSKPTSVKELQERAREHSDVLKGLQHLIQFQGQNIHSQSDQLSKLEKMSEDVATSF